MKKRVTSYAAVLYVMLMILSFCCFAPAVCAAGDDAADEPQITTAAASADQSELELTEVSRKRNSGGGRFIVFGFIAAPLAAGVFALITINGYKNNGKTEPYPFTSKAPLELTEKNDFLINTEVTKRKLNNNSNNN